MTLTLEVDARQVIEVLNGMVARATNPQPAFEDIGTYLVMSTKQRFATKESPDGSPWASNSWVTRKRKGRDDPLIGESGRLGNEIFYQATPDGIEWGSPMEYAAMQQFGGTRSAFPHLWGNIPARPILGLSDEDEVAILDIVAEFMVGR